MTPSGHTLIRYYASILMVLLLMGIAVPGANGAGLRIPMVSGSQGDLIKLPVTIDRVDNLAGIKLALSYDENVLKFIRAEKTSYTSNMLYVVNDRVPGRLVIVMAAAKGFAGENAPLVEIFLELLKEVKKEDNISLLITEAELMTDKLQKISIESR